MGEAAVFGIASWSRPLQAWWLPHLSTIVSKTWQNPNSTSRATLRFGSLRIEFNIFGGQHKRIYYLRVQLAWEMGLLRLHALKGAPIRSPATAASVSELGNWRELNGHSLIGCGIEHLKL